MNGNDPNCHERKCTTKMKFMRRHSSSSSSFMLLVVLLVLPTTSPSTWNHYFYSYLLVPFVAEDFATTTTTTTPSSSASTTTTFVTASFIIGGGRRSTTRAFHHNNANRIRKICDTSDTYFSGGGGDNNNFVRHHHHDDHDKNEHEDEQDDGHNGFQQENRGQLKQRHCQEEQEEGRTISMIQYSRKEFYSTIITATTATTAWASIMPYPSIAAASAAPGVTGNKTPKSSASISSSSSTTVATASANEVTTTATTTTTTTTKICQNGALIPETPVPGAYNSICMNLPQRELVFPPYNNNYNNNNKDSDNSIHVTIQQLTSGSGKTGMAVWNSGLLLSRLLVNLVTYDENFTNWWKTLPCVLELGCGTGLTSIVGWKLGAPYVLATDGNVDVLQLTKSNIKLNTHTNGNDSNDKGDTNNNNVIETKELSWGLLNAMDYNEMANVIIGSDLTYNSGTWNVLAETMATILKEDGIIIYLSLGHDGFNVRAELDEGFLSVAKSYGLLPVSKLTIPNTLSTSTSSSEESSTTTSSSSSSSSISLDQLLDQVITSTERQQVIQPSGGARVVVLQKKSYLSKQQQKKKMMQQ